MGTGRNLTASAGLGIAIGLGVLTVAATTHADQIGPYAGRSLTLGRGTFRIDGGPPDFGYFHPGAPHWLNESRGLRVRIETDSGQEYAWAGVGPAYGITRDLEIGGNVPIRISPDGDIDDVEVYGRYRFLDGNFEMGVQLTFQPPLQEETAAGLGAGVPMLVHATDSFRIDTGVELELMFFDPNTAVNVDAPIALTWDLGPHALLGLRTGLYLWDGNDLLVPAGIHGGAVLAEGCLDLIGWFMWPEFFLTRGGDPMRLQAFELGFGINGRID